MKKTRLLSITGLLAFGLMFGANLTQAQSTPVTLFSNLGPSSTDLFFTGESASGTNGGCIVGADKLGGNLCGGRNAHETWQAMPFIATQNSHATELQAAVGVLGGTNQFLLALFTDDNGLPGTALATVTVTDAPAANTCCTLATASLGTPGIALTAGKQYWVVVQTDDVNAPNFSGIWAFSNNGPAVHDLGSNGQVEWRTEGGNFAFAVQGTTP